MCSLLVGVGLQQSSSRVSSSVLDGVKLGFEVSALSLSCLQLQPKAAHIVLCIANHDVSDLFGADW